MKTFEDYIKEKIKNGFISERDGEPLKCPWCESKELENKNYDYGGMGVEEYEKWCKPCNKRISGWAYGSWEL